MISEKIIKFLYFDLSTQNHKFCDLKKITKKCQNIYVSLNLYYESTESRKRGLTILTLR